MKRTGRQDMTHKNVRREASCGRPLSFKSNIYLSIAQSATGLSTLLACLVAIYLLEVIAVCLRVYPASSTDT